jgi:hypothetical protein
MQYSSFVLSVLILSVPVTILHGQEAASAKAAVSEPVASAAANPNAAVNPASKDPRYQSLEKMLTNVVLIGMFTVDRKKMNDLAEERYEIKSIKKLADDDDLWALEARIKYGDHDVTVPIVTTILWADKTPVITMDRMIIPGLGTFSARVVFHDNKYAGTWTHDANGGHLFGRIEPIKP